MNVIRKIVNEMRVLRDLPNRVEALQTELDSLRSRLEVDEAMQRGFMVDRASPEYQAVYEKERPLVSICIGTYNRSKLLMERSVGSALAQSHENIEVVVVGDHCTDDTAERIANIDDPRLTFLNLPKRGEYPQEPLLRWMVAGTASFNKALELAKGDFITHLDDDDEHEPERVAKLVAFMKKTRADLVWHPFWAESATGKWALIEAQEFRRARVTTSSIFYHRWFRRLPWDISAYRYHEPGDWNRLRKIQYLGARIVKYPEPLLRHYREGTQRS